MSDTVTIVGKVGNEPTRSQTPGGVPVVNFRLASGQRRYDARSGQWIDQGTNWYSVAAFRQLAEHVKVSLRKGDSVIVTGRLKLREWEYNDRKYSSVDIEAESVGHDLRWGTSAFAKAARIPRPDTERTDTERADTERTDAGTSADTAGVGSAPSNDGADHAPVGAEPLVGALAAGHGWDTPDGASDDEQAPF